MFVTPWTVGIALGLSSAPAHDRPVSEEASPTADATPADPAPPPPQAEAEPRDAGETTPSSGGSQPIDRLKKFFQFGSTRRKQTPALAKVPRPFTVGLEGVITSTPALQSRVIPIDPRYIGRSVALGGGGIFGRYRPLALLGVDLSVRSGSVRFRSDNNNDSVSQDQVSADIAALLYLARGDVVQFALSGGIGGSWNRIGYQFDDGEEAQHVFGSALFRVGGEVEFHVKRVSFVLSFRNYVSVTDRDKVRRKGDALQEDTPANSVAPVATFQSMLSGSAGIGYRF